MRTDVHVPSGGEQLAVWHFAAEGDALAGAAGRPCVVLAHGFGGTRDSGLEPFAQAFAAAGADALLFDFRGFGASSGEPRQRLDPAMQRADYAAVVAHARTLGGVDPDRVVVWGTSFSGGHAFRIAKDDPRVGAVIAMTPAPDGMAALRAILARDGAAHVARHTANGNRDLVAHVRGGARHTVPIVGDLRDGAVLTAPGAAERMLAIAGPTWRNEVCADILAKIALYRPGTAAKGLTCPVLVQVGDVDQTAPPLAAMWAAKRARAEVRHLPADHFDVYPGGPHHERAIAQQVDFLRRTFAPVREAVGAA